MPSLSVAFAHNKDARDEAHVGIDNGMTRR
jgi:hypothetical protein